jgi:Protein required for attachment to host cells
MPCASAAAEAVRVVQYIEALPSCFGIVAFRAAVFVTVPCWQRQRPTGVGTGPCGRPASPALQVAAGTVPSTAHRHPAGPGSGRPGASLHSHATAHHAITPGHDPHMLEKEMFAKVVAGQLNAAAGRQDFDDLILVAPPRTLKTIHDTLDAATRERVIFILGKDRMPTSEQDLLPYVQEWMFRSGYRAEAPSD